MSDDNIIEIICNDYLIEVEDAQYELVAENITVLDYIYAGNKPSINQVVLLGDKTSQDLGLVDCTQMPLKEDKLNKVTTLFASSSDENYPSAKCVYDELLQKSSSDLNNLTLIGEAHFANPDLSNLSVTGQDKLDNKADASLLDGNWTTHYAVLNDSLAIGTYTIDLSSILPNDGRVYELLLVVFLDNTNGVQTIRIGTDIVSPIEFVAAGNNAPWARDVSVIPVGTGRTLTCGKYIHDASATSKVALCGYRRVS